MSNNSSGTGEHASRCRQKARWGQKEPGLAEKALPSWGRKPTGEGRASGAYSLFHISKPIPSFGDLHLHTLEYCLSFMFSKYKEWHKVGLCLVGCCSLGCLLHQEER